MRTIISRSCGTYPLKVLSFKRFVDQYIPERITANAIRTYPFNQLVSRSEQGATAFDPSIDESSYKRIELPLYNPSEQELKGLIMTQASVKYLQRSFRDMAEEAVMAHIEQFGEPTCLVRLSRRCWLVASPDDYRWIRNDRGTGLACLDRTRILVFLVGRK